MAAPSRSLRFTLAALGALTTWAACVACSSSGHTAPGADGGSLLGDSGVVVVPDTESCTGDATRCLHGTAGAPGFTATPRAMQVQVYSVFPSAAASPVATVPVARDGTWAVSALPPSTHYYAQVLADFGQPKSVGALQGPLGIPSTAALSLVVAPVQAQLLEQIAGGASTVAWVEGHIFDPASGAEVTGSSGSFTIELGGAQTVVPYGTDAAGVAAYYLTLPAGTPAQPTYTGLASAPGADAPKPIAWSLSAAPPSFTPSLTAPADGTTIAVGQSLAVSWPAEPTADYVLVELYTMAGGSGGSWSPVYTSQTPEASTTSSETIPAASIAQAGAYLLNVDFSTASCPSGKSGCVIASAVADAQLTAQ